MRTGIIGLSDGNGHPFSFSAIVNGYDDQAFGDAGWPVIHDYLKAQPAENFGFPDARITHAWTQDRELTERLAAACRIGTVCAAPEDMVDAVDAVLIARDDWETHMPLARPFLEAGKHVFVDKPVTLDMGELSFFEPYIRDGRLMSCSGLRYAHELDELRGQKQEERLGDIRLVSGSVLNDIEKYGIHLLEAVASLGGALARPRSLTRLDAEHQAYALMMANGTLFQLNCLGAVGKTFHLSFFGTRAHRHYDLHDNFSAFRRTLAAFYEMVRSGEPPIEPGETCRLMRLLMAARSLEPGETWHVE